MPSILSSFGLQVGLQRHKNDSQLSFNAEDDINFLILSYDVGFEKPDSRIFDAAKQMVPGQERYLHVGDDLRKDYYAAKRAGWEGFLLDRGVENSEQNIGSVPRITDLQELTSHII